MGLQIFDERTVYTQLKLALPADGVGVIALVAVNQSDRRVDSITVANRDTIAHVVNLLLVNGAVTVNLGSVSVAAGAGYAGTPSVDLLASVLPATQVGFPLASADSLSVQLAVAIQATFDMSFHALGGIF